MKIIKIILESIIESWKESDGNMKTGLMVSFVGALFIVTMIIISKKSSNFPEKIAKIDTVSITTCFIEKLHYKRPAVNNGKTGMSLSLNCPDMKNIKFEIKSNEMNEILNVSNQNAELKVSYYNKSKCIKEIKHKLKTLYILKGTSSAIEFRYLLGLDEDSCIGFKNDIY